MEYITYLLYDSTVQGGPFSCTETMPPDVKPASDTQRFPDRWAFLLEWIIKQIFQLKQQLHLLHMFPA